MNLPSSALSPSSPEAGALAHLFLIDLGVAVAIFLLVTALVIGITARWRARGGSSDPPQTGGNRTLEIAWTVGPTIIVVLLFIASLGAMSAADPPRPASGPDLVVIGHQWWWEIRYPRAGVVTANEIHIPVGRPLSVALESADVIHDFWVPQLSRKSDLVPGQRNHIWLRASTPGIYLGACAEYCGAEHAWMRLRVTAESPGAFDAWLAGQRAIPGALSGEAATGARLFHDLACVSCHTIAGTSTAGTAGPDLTHVGSRATLGAGVIDNGADGMARWLENPQAVKPGNLMPDFRLNRDEVRALVAYLGSLR